MEPAVARTGRLDKIRNLLDEIRRYYDKIMVKISNRLVTACRLTSVTLFCLFALTGIGTILLCLFGNN